MRERVMDKTKKDDDDIIKLSKYLENSCMIYEVFMDG